MSPLAEPARPAVVTSPAPDAAASRWGRLVGPAELRAVKTTSATLGVAALVYLGANLAAVQQHHPDALAHWWWITALTGRLLFGIALMVVPWFASAATLRSVVGGFAILGLVSVASSIPATAAGMAWTLRGSLFALAAALAFRPRWAWIWIAAIELLAIPAEVFRAPDPLPLIESTLVSVGTTVVLVLVVMAVLRTARVTDLREQSALRAIREDLDRAAAAAERRRIERVVHDEVLSTLRAASLGLSTTRADPALMARAALDRLTTMALSLDDHEESHDVDVLLNRLRAFVTSIAPDAEFRVSSAGAPRVPAGATQAMAEASGEALRNSVAHALPGHPIARTVHVRVDPDAIKVTIADDGDGFDLRHVPPHRLGVARSIVERMQALPGGDAEVQSKPGSGTSITLSWRA